MKKYISVAWLHVERVPDLTLELLPPSLLIFGGIVTVLLGATR